MESLQEIASELVKTYSECPGIHHLDTRPLPNRDAILRIVDDLRELAFPGFGQRQNLHLDTVAFHAGNLLINIYDELRKQIARACVHDCKEEKARREDFQSIADEKAIAFLKTLPEIRRQLSEDVQAAYDGDPAASGPYECVFTYPGIEAVMIYRMAHELHKLKTPLIPRVMTEHAHSKTGIDIHPGASIGRRFFIDHGTGVVIGETCRIGDQVKIYQGVTLGALSFPVDDRGIVIRGRKRHPTIEDNVVIYASATILGGETVIGHHSVIGSSVWLTSSVDPYTIVTLEMPRLRFRGPNFFEI